MSKTNKNKAVDPDYAKLKRENARLKAPHNTIAERLNEIIKLVFFFVRASPPAPQNRH